MIRLIFVTPPNFFLDQTCIYSRVLWIVNEWMTSVHWQMISTTFMVISGCGLFKYRIEFLARRTVSRIYPVGRIKSNYFSSGSFSVEVCLVCVHLFCTNCLNGEAKIFGILGIYRFLFLRW